MSAAGDLTERKEPTFFSLPSRKRDAATTTAPSHDGARVQRTPSLDQAAGKVPNTASVPAPPSLDAVVEEQQAYDQLQSESWLVAPPIEPGRNPKQPDAQPAAADAASLERHALIAAHIMHGGESKRLGIKQSRSDTPPVTQAVNEDPKVYAESADVQPRRRPEPWEKRPLPAAPRPQIDAAPTRETAAPAIAAPDQGARDTIKDEDAMTEHNPQPRSRYATAPAEAMTSSADVIPLHQSGKTADPQAIHPAETQPDAMAVDDSAAEIGFIANAQAHLDELEATYDFVNLVHSTTNNEKFQKLFMDSIAKLFAEHRQSIGFAQELRQSYMNLAAAHDAMQGEYDMLAYNYEVISEQTAALSKERDTALELNDRLQNRIEDLNHQMRLCQQKLHAAEDLIRTHHHAQAEFLSHQTPF